MFQRSLLLRQVSPKNIQRSFLKSNCGICFYSTAVKNTDITKDFGNTNNTNNSILKRIEKIGEILKDENVDKKSNIKFNSNKKITDNKNQKKNEEIVDGSYLNKYFSENTHYFHELNKNQISYLNRFFNDAKVELDWSIYDYLRIPGEEERLNKEEQVMSKFEAQEEQEQDQELLQEQKDEEDDLEDFENAEKSSINENMKKGTIKSIERKEKKLNELENFNNLPEIIFLGRCNVGKSSLINSLLTNLKFQENEKYARVKRLAGYTPCLNFYNIGGLFRLVDSPGYGVKGKDWQGELTFQYLNNRRNLRNCYLLLDAKIGLNDYDELIINNLVELGISFDIIFNKIDKIKDNSRIDHLNNIIKNSVLDKLLIKPKFFFINSVVEPNSKKSNLNFKSGLNDLRFNILNNNCGYEINSNLKPKSKKKLIDPNTKGLKLKNMKRSLSFTQKKSSTKNNKSKTQSKSS
ncbi:hypothetical protein BVG19_g5068 [[Candida] boidinii]|nr:hypothetical protein BVG19_g5068 [[Candida] boidinii]OWB53645.1 hypothetical protein B5S27_g5251 [[Candida] boidinii]OWB85573.1 hypothetical protein B5S33_g4242 [[Candida] boidinii]